MVSLEEAVQIALRLAAEDPPPTPILGASEIFSMDGGESWTVHLREDNVRVVGDRVITRMPCARVVIVDGRTGAANWAVMM
jgi:hypothetical protein